MGSFPYEQVKRKLEVSPPVIFNLPWFLALVEDIASPTSDISAFFSIQW